MIQYSYSGLVINFPQNIATVAQRLPHSIPVLSRYIILRRGCADGFTDFFVDRDKVLECLEWLIEHNPYYRNIQIDYNNLEDLPAPAASVFDAIHQSQQERNRNEQEDPNSLSDDDFDDGIVTDSGAPNLIIRDNQRQVNRVLGILEENQENLDDLALGIRVNQGRETHDHIQWPDIEARPINEFQEQGYIVRTFPKIKDLHSMHVCFRNEYRIASCGNKKWWYLHSKMSSFKRYQNGSGIEQLCKIKPPMFQKNFSI